MKVKRPPQPVTEEVVASSSDAGGEDISEPFSRLSIYNANNSKSVRNNILPDYKRDGEGGSKEGEKEERSAKKEEGKKAEEKGGRRRSDEGKSEDGEREDEKEKKEPTGDLLSRGPVGVESKWKSAGLASVQPYPTHTRTISGGTNGGCLLYDSQSSASYPELRVKDSFSPEQCNDYINYAPVTPPELNIFGQLVHEQTLSIPSNLLPQNLDDNIESDFFDKELKKCIQEVTSDPVKVESLVKDIESEASRLGAPLIDLSPNSTTHNIQEQRCSFSPNQVVPQRRTSLSSSAYSTSSGSPSSSSSPSPYGNTPNYSPNVPSPQVNLCDDSSNTMYSPPCRSMLHSPLQRPLSTCSSSSTNCSSSDLDVFDLNDIFRPSDVKDKQKLQEIQQYLDTSCSEDYKASCNLQSSCLGSMQQPANSSIVVIYGVPNQPSFQKRLSESSGSVGRRGPRTILPKPTNSSMLPVPAGESILNAQELLLRQPVKQSKLPQKLGAYPMPVKEQLLQRLDPVKKPRAWVQVLSYTDEYTSKIDHQGDTVLMMLVCRPEILQKLEYLYALVERCKTIPGLLALKNNDKHSALYMACMLVHHEPLVAIYIAEALMDIDCDMNVKDGDDGSTLIHQLCIEDKYSTVLDELLSLKDRRGKRGFDINMVDFRGRTPLHLAVENHNNGVPCLEIVKVLLRHGANVLEKDLHQGSTALHLALATNTPDENLVHTLCNFGNNTADNSVQGTESNLKCDLVNAKNYKGDTPLHVAMAYEGGGESQTHNCILEILLEAGAARAIRNLNGKAPLELAPDARKAEIKRILDKYSAK